MKLSKPTVLLILLNVASLGGAAYLYSGRPSQFLETTPTSTAVTSEPIAPPSPVVQTSIVTVVQTNGFLWAQLESEDYRTYIDRLRSIGCPEATIRDIIIADLESLMAPQLRQLTPRRQALKYWEPEDAELRNDVDQREVAKKQQEIEFQKREIVRALVGADLAAERANQQGREDYYGRRLGFLPPERQDAVRAILESYQREEAAFRETADLDTAIDRQELRELYNRQQAQIAGMLTPEEMAQFDLWFSPTAQSVRNSVYGMSATEEEFLKIYQLQKTFDETWTVDEADLASNSTRQQWEEAKSALDEQLRQDLGEERYTAYKRGQDPDFHELNATITRFKLPREKAQQVYDFKRVAEAERQKIEADPELSPGQKRFVLKAISEETEAALRESLGDKAFRYFKQRSQSDWLRK